MILVSLDVQSQEKIKTGAERCSDGKQHRAITSPFAKRSSPNAPKHSFDVLHYSINIDLYKNYSIPFPKSFNGSVIVKLRADSAILSIKLDTVYTSLSIDSVTLAGTSFTHSGNILTIQLYRTYQQNETLNVAVYYKHKDFRDALKKEILQKLRCIAADS